MFCDTCSAFSMDSKSTYNDCIIESLEKIKMHYIKFKKSFDDNKSLCEILQSENMDLRGKISVLEEKLLSINSPNKKRRKVSTSYSSYKNYSDLAIDNDENKCDSTSLLSSSFSCTSLNASRKTSSEELAHDDLNQAMDITEVDWSESFDIQHTQHQNKSTPKKNSDENNRISPRKVLSPSNSNNNYALASSTHQLQRQQSSSTIPQSPQLDNTHLPRRLKLSSKKEENNENRKPLETIKTTGKWIKTKESKTLAKAVSRNLGMSFIQPHKSSSSLSKVETSDNCSTNIEIPLSKEETITKKTCAESPPSNLSLKSHSKLRQTRLLFDIVKDNKNANVSDIDETFCEDFIEPSPTSALSHIEDGNKTTKKKNLSSFSRKKNEKNLFLFALKQSGNKSNPVPLMDCIKKSPDSRKENDGKNLKLILTAADNEMSNDNSTKNDNDDNCKDENVTAKQDSSSVIVLSNEPDDVIVIENTDIDYNKFNANALIEEMTMRYDDMPTYCETIEKIRRIDTEKQDNKPEIVERRKESNEIEDIIKSGCLECQEYFRYVGRNLTIDEIRSRIRNCKHKNVFDINPTPEGYWDPVLRPFSENDPRNETLIDDRFIVDRKPK